MKKINIKLQACLKTIPKQSHFNFDFFIAMPGLAESKEPAWLSENFTTYILLKPGADYKSLQTKLPQFLRNRDGLTDGAAVAEITSPGF